MEKLTYTYKFADGTTSEVEVSEELYLELKKITEEEKRNHFKECRKGRHVSLEFLKEIDAQIEDHDADPLDPILSEEEVNELYIALSKLPEKHQKLIKQYFYEGLTTSQIAEIEGIRQPTISEKIQLNIKKLKKLLQKNL